MVSNRVIGLWVVVVTAVGTGLILTQGALWTAVGVILVIVGLMSLMPAIRQGMAQEPRAE